MNTKVLAVYDKTRFALAERKPSARELIYEFFEAW